MKLVEIIEENEPKTLSKLLHLATTVLQRWTPHFMTLDSTIFILDLTF